MAVLPPRRRCPASPRRTVTPTSSLLRLMRQTCCPPCGFGIASHTGSLPGCCQPLLAQAPSVVVSANPFLRVWTLPRLLQVHMPVTSPRTLAFPGETSGRRDAISPTATSLKSAEFSPFSRARLAARGPRSSLVSRSSSSQLRRRSGGWTKSISSHPSRCVSFSSSRKVGRPA